MALSDTKVRALKPREKLHKVADDRGLYLKVRPNGSKLWRYIVNQAFRRMGFTMRQVTAHGLRTTASTLLNKSGEMEPRCHRTLARPCRCQSHSRDI